MNSAENVPPLGLAIAAVPYSSNLGDGIIHDIMTRILQGDAAPPAVPATAVATLDLSGRTCYAGLDPVERNRRKRSLRIINALPALLRRPVVLVYALLLYWRKNRAQYAAALRGVDHVIIGGGHLFSDLDLNFPAKLFCLHFSLKRFQVPFSIYGVGASDNWSVLGRWLFRRILRSPLLKGITVRDGYSEQIVARELRAVGRTLPLSQVWDPAVATALYYQDAVPEPFPETAPDFSLRTASGSLRTASGSPLAAPGSRRHVGVNVADLALLATAGDRATGIDEGLKFFRLLIARLQEQRYRVTLFTNGAEEDETFLERLCAEPGIRCARAQRPLTPGDLIALIRQFDCVVSHRLHAHIVCFSYAIPSIGLGWDTKVASFFQLAGRADFLVDSAQQGTKPDIAGRVLDRLADTSGAGATRSRAAAVEARQQLQDFLRTVVTP